MGSWKHGHMASGQPKAWWSLHPFTAFRTAVVNERVNEPSSFNKEHAWRGLRLLLAGQSQPSPALIGAG